MTAHRQCSECIGCDHHWTIGDAQIDEHDPAAEYGCKHCDAEADCCDDCNGFDEECAACGGIGVVPRIELEIGIDIFYPSNAITWAQMETAIDAGEIGCGRRGHPNAALRMRFRNTYGADDRREWQAWVDLLDGLGSP